MHDRSQWARGTGGHGRNKKLVEFSRKCATCGEPFSILVTEKIAAGKADSNAFGLRNCELHRRSKPRAQDPAAELAELKARDIAQFREIQQLKAKLAAYQHDEYIQKARKREKMPWQAGPRESREPYYATGQPVPRTPADGDWEGD